MARFNELLEADCWKQGEPRPCSRIPILIKESEAIRIALLYLCGTEHGEAMIETNASRPKYIQRPDFIGNRDSSPEEFGWLFCFYPLSPPGFTFEMGSFFLFVHDPSGDVERTLAI